MSEGAMSVDPSVAKNIAADTSPGGRWYAVKAKTCADKDISVGWGAWTVVGSDGGQYPASGSTYTSFPVPEYPFGEGKVPAGRCVLGWIVFAVNKDSKITGVTYSNGHDEPVSWKVP